MRRQPIAVSLSLSLSHLFLCKNDLKNVLRQGLIKLFVCLFIYLFIYLLKWPTMVTDDGPGPDTLHNHSP